jgi:hypothetical protein
MDAGEDDADQRHDRNCNKNSTGYLKHGYLGGKCSSFFRGFNGYLQLALDLAKSADGELLEVRRHDN